MVLYPHAKTVDEDAEKNSLLENSVVHHKVQASSDSAKEVTDGRDTSGYASKKK